MAFVNGQVLTADQLNTINAPTATALQTPRAINGVSFDGTAAITVPAVVPADLLSTSDATKGSALVGFKPNYTGGIGRLLNLKLQDWRTPEDYGAKGDGTTDDTTAIQTAITDCIAAGKSLVFTAPSYVIGSVQVSGATSSFQMHSAGSAFLGNAASAQPSLIDIVNCVDFDMTGNWRLSAQGNTHYAAALSVRASGSGVTSRCNFYGIMAIDAIAAISVGTYNNDLVCSEITFFGAKSYGCPVFLIGGGSQTLATFVGCNMTPVANASFSGSTPQVMLLKGGAWQFVGGEMVQVGSTSSYIVEAEPATSTTYSNPYPVAKFSGVHIESAGLLLFLHNPAALASPASYLSAFSFQNCTGYMGALTTGNVVDTTGDNIYAGKIVFGNSCNFYAGSTTVRTGAHFALGTNTVIDIDGSPFNSSFLQGLSGLVSGFMGKPRLRGETILALYGSTTAVGNSGNTIIYFPSYIPTQDSAYGNSGYSSGSWTAPQAMKDVTVSFQVIFTSAAANADVFVCVNGTNIGFYGVQKGATVQSGSVVIPALSKGDVVTLVGNSNTGSSVALTGGASSFFRINART